jgi:hypothetical protein
MLRGHVSIFFAVVAPLSDKKSARLISQIQKNHSKSPFGQISDDVRNQPTTFFRLPRPAEISQTLFSDFRSPRKSAKRIFPISAARGS